MNEPTKICRECKVEHPATTEFFARHEQCKHGVDAWCKSCRSRYARGWKRRNSEILAAQRRENYAGEKGEHQREVERRRAERYPYRVSASILMSGVRERSKEFGWGVHPLLRTKDFFEAWLRRQPKCECCSVTLRIGRKGDAGLRQDDAPSIDRFDSGRGYDLDNIALVCWRCNNIKRNYLECDLRMVADWMGRKREAPFVALVDCEETQAQVVTVCQPRIVKVFGEEMSMSGAAKRYGINQSTLYARLKRGWSIENALTTATDDRFGRQVHPRPRPAQKLREDADSALLKDLPRKVSKRSDWRKSGQPQGGQLLLFGASGASKYR